MTQENKICQNCRNQFPIEPEDFQFYDRIQVPPPTFCPQCRMRNKLIWSNEGALFRVKCQAPGHSEELISRYAPERGLKIYDSDYWRSDAWDPMSYGRDYDFTKPFFQQHKELLESVPWFNVYLINSTNCDYCTWASNSKNCYLVSGAYLSEDCMYSDTPAVSRNCIDASILIFCENIYESIGCTKCFNLKFSEYSIECIDSSFLYDCRNCSNCFGCVGLRNKQYYIWNKPYSKQEYEEEIKTLNIGSHKILGEVKEKFKKLKNQVPKKYMFEKNTVGCSGNDIENAKNCKHCFEIRDGAENGKYLLVCGRRIKDSYDVFAGGEKCELVYSSSAFNSQNIKFSSGARESVDLQYCETCDNCEHLFSCVGLRNKKYCIFNKQYSKDEYEQLVPKIIQHMNEMPYIDKKGNVYKYGEFFPPEFSFCAYNDSLAQQYFPLTKETAEKEGVWWREIKKNDHPDLIKIDNIPNDIKDIKTDDFEGKIIECGHKGNCLDQCKGAFKVIRKELEFYQRFNIALPRLCPECRRRERVEGKRRYNLEEKKCMCQGKNSHDPSTDHEYKNLTEHFHKNDMCQNRFQTGYTSEQDGIIYCSDCYNSEIQ